MLLAFETGQRLRAAVVGCGNHAYRSVLPCFDYVAVDLIATADVDLPKARIYATHFGAKAACGSLKEVIARGDVQAIFLAAGPTVHPQLACEALEGGLHVWLEKPPAIDVAGVDRIIAAQRHNERNVAVGFKKIFMPAIARMKSIINSGRLGAVRTIQARFPMDIPADGPAVLREAKANNWLNNGVHPLSAMVHLGGRPESLVVHRATTGGGFVILCFPSGAVGSLHLAQGHSSSGPMERYEVVCEQGHMVLENNCRLTIYRPGYPFDYARGNDFTAGDESVAAIVYEPQNTLSTLENKAIFLQGFVQEVDHFVEACLKGTSPTLGTLGFARSVMECYEAGLLSQGQSVRLDELSAVRKDAAV